MYDVGCVVAAAVAVCCMTAAVGAVMVRMTRADKIASPRLPIMVFVCFLKSLTLVYVV